MRKSLAIFIYVTAFILIFRAGPAFSSDAVKTAGDIGALAIPAAAGIMTLVYNDREGTFQLAKAYVSSMAVTYGLKYSIDVKRPNGEKHSFPSAHTASAFAGAAFVQQRDGWKYGIPLYLAASFVGYSRIESKEHRFQDVLAGAAIGIASNLIFTTPFKGVTVSPVVGGGFKGAVAQKSF